MRGPSPAVRDTLDGIPWEEGLEKARKGAGVFLGSAVALEEMRRAPCMSAGVLFAWDLFELVKRTFLRAFALVRWLRRAGYTGRPISLSGGGTGAVH